jgi:hypothetical protein
MEARQALRAFRFTRDPRNAFSISMDEGLVVSDKRPISGKPGEPVSQSPFSERLDGLKGYLRTADIKNTIDSLVDKLAQRAHFSTGDIIASNRDPSSANKSKS